MSATGMTPSVAAQDRAVRNHMLVGGMIGGVATGIGAYSLMAGPIGIVSGTIGGGFLGTAGAGVSAGIAAVAQGAGLHGAASAAVGGGITSAAAIAGLGLLAAAGGPGGKLLALMGAPLAGGAVGATIGGLVG